VFLFTAAMASCQYQHSPTSIQTAAWQSLQCNGSCRHRCCITWGVKVPVKIRVPIFYFPPIAAPPMSKHRWHPRARGWRDWNFSVFWQQVGVVLVTFLHCRSSHFFLHQEYFSSQVCAIYPWFKYHVSGANHCKLSAFWLHTVFLISQMATDLTMDVVPQADKQTKLLLCTWILTVWANGQCLCQCPCLAGMHNATSEWGKRG
jgi:hypothetical protein